MDRSELKKFVRDDGVLDEFALMSSEKKVAPLHYVLFRSHAAHLGHEANTESLVSRAGISYSPRSSRETDENILAK